MIKKHPHNVSLCSHCLCSRLSMPRSRVRTRNIPLPKPFTMTLDNKRVIWSGWRYHYGSFDSRMLALLVVNPVTRRPHITTRAYLLHG